MVLLHLALSLTMSRTGLLVGRDRTTIRHGLRLALTDPRLIARQAGLRTLEPALRQWAEAFADHTRPSPLEGR
jgi:hypothetical protein